MTYPHRLICTATLSVALLSSGCQTLWPGAQAEPAATDAASAESEDVPEALPPAVAESLLPPLRTPEPSEALVEEQRFDLAVKNAPAREFFMNLVEGTRYDLVVHPEVTGEISLVLKGATIMEVLEAVRDVYGYDFRRNRTGFYVLPSKLRSQIFQVDYLNVQRTGLSQTRVSSGQLTDQVGDSPLSASPLGPIVTGDDRNRGVLESSQVKTDSKTDLWAELREGLLSIVGEGEGRSVVVSPQAGIIVVRAMPAELRQVAEYLDRTQNILTRQVILDARILEVELSDGYQTGINWAALIESGTKSALFGQTGGGTLLEEGLSEIAGNTGTLDPNDPSFPSNTDTSAFGGVVSAALDISNFTAFIELLETQGDVQVLSSPRVSTVNNQKAVIKVGQDEFFVTDVSSTTVTGTVATTTPDVTLTPFFSGIALDVLPQIADDGSVILHVHPSISQAQDQTKQITLGEDTLTLPLALTTIRETDTVVRARSGQLVVIGGLIQDVYRKDAAQVPFLGRIPYLGWLFGQRRGDFVKSELVILLRPRVIGSGTWARAIDGIEGRMEAFDVDPELIRADPARRAEP